MSHCYECLTARAKQHYLRHHDRIVLEQRAYNRRTIKQRPTKLPTNYGMTVSEYWRMYEEQIGHCAICHQPQMAKGKRWLGVDHNHKTGKIRGLLCNQCNSGLGGFKDNPGLLRVAAAYLENHAV